MQRQQVLEMPYAEGRKAAAGEQQRAERQAPEVLRVEHGTAVGPALERAASVQHPRGVAGRALDHVAEIALVHEAEQLGFAADPQLLHAVEHVAADVKAET